MCLKQKGEFVDGFGWLTVPAYSLILIVILMPACNEDWAPVLTTILPRPLKLEKASSEKLISPAE
jgi:hypothetical protein